MGLAVGSTVPRPRPRGDLPAPAAALAARPGRVRAGRPEGPARGGALPPARAPLRLRGRPHVRRVPRPAPARRARDLLVRGSPRDRGARRALGRLRDRAVRARLGRQGLADRPQPARRHRPAARRARPRARRPRPDRLPRARACGPRAPSWSSSTRRRGDPRPPRDRGRAGATRRAARRRRSPSGPRPRSRSSPTARSSASRSRRARRPPMPYDDVYAMATPGRAFDMFTNQAHALRARRPAPARRQPDAVRRRARRAAALMRETDDEIVARFLADLHELYPQTRGVDRRRDRAALGARQRLRAPRPRPPAARARGRARRRTRTCTWPATTSPSWGTWRPPPAPGSRPPNASTPDSER